MLNSIADNLKQINDRIERAAKRAGRDARDIILIAVTKTVPVDTIEEAVRSGIFKDIGENRIQEARPKIKALGDKARWHMIGHLQANKAKDAVAIFDLIHSVDSLELAEEINKRAKGVGKVQNILIEVKTSSEATKHGVPTNNALPLVKDIAKLSNVRIKGLMTMAPFVDNPEKARPYFVKCRLLSDKINKEKIRGVEMRYLSMGMSNDFEVAIEEGSNMVRIGRAIFG